MHKIVEELEEGGAIAKWCEDVRKNLKDAKQYLKTAYGMHCLEDRSPCLEHCMRVCVFLLAIPKTPSFKELVPMNLKLAVIVAKV